MLPVPNTGNIAKVISNTVSSRRRFIVKDFAGIGVRGILTWAQGETVSSFESRVVGLGTHAKVHKLATLSVTQEILILNESKSGNAHPET